MDRAGFELMVRYPQKTYYRGPDERRKISRLLMNILRSNSISIARFYLIVKKHAITYFEIMRLFHYKYHFVY